MSDAGVRYVMCPTDLLDEAWYRRLRPRFSDLAERVFRLVILAQAQQPTNGRILGARNSPLQAEDIASRCPGFSEEEVSVWEDLLAALCAAGILQRHAEGGWEFVRRTDWWRLSKETAEYQAAKKARQRANGDAPPAPAPSPSPCVPPCPPVVPQSLHESGKGKEENGKRKDPPPPPSSEGHEPAAPADEEEASVADAGEGPPSLPDPAPWGPSSDASGLESLRTLVGQAMQQLGLMGAPTGPWWNEFTAWAWPGFEAGAKLEDIAGALAYGRDAARHAREVRPGAKWAYAMTVARRELGPIAQRNALRRAWEAGGRRGPEPRPYVWTPPEPRPDAAPPPNGSSRRGPPARTPAATVPDTTDRR